MGFDYFYEENAELFAFYRIPKILFTDLRFRELSTEGKVLYGLFLDRVSLSRDNGWVDENKRVYIIFTVEAIRDYLGCSEKSAIKYLAELDESGLIERKRQGLGKPTLIYVKNFSERQNVWGNATNNENMQSIKIQIQTYAIYSLIILIITMLILLILAPSYLMMSGWDMRNILTDSLR